MLLVFGMSVHAQNDSIISAVNDSTTIKLKYGLRIGGDVGKLIRSFTDNNYSGFEVNGDYRIKNNLYIAGELGIEDKHTTTNYLDVTSKGSYIKAGVDYNMYRNWLDMDNMIFAGFRIGASTFSQTLNSYSVYSTDQYWQPQFSTTDSQNFSGLTAIWAELILGIKVELFNNLYLGLNAQLKGLVNETKPTNFQNIYIPGFHKTYDSSKVGVGYGYTISYLIPLYKKNKK
ncbi:hypothetical protein GCM10007962_28450 [Yeosuana aromativorans]|uniref:Uncharacterized protein n=2 Tax=Yeosuana aromativorans TaxID=288019 RepID=A0A8J3FIG1_9FLAO|nr:hypothetical protein GCM10007962_28450 [Yeosuana aromativorans]